MLVLRHSNPSTSSRLGILRVPLYTVQSMDYRGVKWDYIALFVCLSALFFHFIYTLSDRMFYAYLLLDSRLVVSRGKAADSSGKKYILPVFTVHHTPVMIIHTAMWPNAKNQSQLSTTTFPQVSLSMVAGYLFVRFIFRRFLL